jgi:hypothetical protein
MLQGPRLTSNEKVRAAQVQYPSVTHLWIKLKNFVFFTSQQITRLPAHSTLTSSCLGVIHFFPLPLSLPRSLTHSLLSVFTLYSSLHPPHLLHLFLLFFLSYPSSSSSIAFLTHSLSPLSFHHCRKALSLLVVNSHPRKRLAQQALVTHNAKSEPVWQLQAQLDIVTTTCPPPAPSL